MVSVSVTCGFDHTFSPMNQDAMLITEKGSKIEKYSFFFFIILQKLSIPCMRLPKSLCSTVLKNFASRLDITPYLTENNIWKRPSNKATLYSQPLAIAEVIVFLYLSDAFSTSPS